MTAKEETSGFFTTPQCFNIEDLDHEVVMLCVSVDSMDGVDTTTLMGKDLRSGHYYVISQQTTKSKEIVK